MKSCLYEGQVRHRRFLPKPHDFSYRIFYVLLDLDELDRVFNRRWLWSTTRFAIARFRNSDHLDGKDESLKEKIYDKVEEKTGIRPGGPVRLLTHLRYFGYVFNPVSFYYVYDKEDTRVETIVAEVNNTPWGERHIYVLPANGDDTAEKVMKFSRDKEFHVSPFMSMDIDYQWNFTEPRDNLAVHMENYQDNNKIFDATMKLNREPVNAVNCTRVLIRYPFMTIKVFIAIYWQALKLLIKGTPLYNHPEKITRSEEGADKA